MIVVPGSLNSSQRVDCEQDEGRTILAHQRLSSTSMNEIKLSEIPCQ